MSRKSKMILTWVCLGPPLLLLGSYSRWFLVPLIALGVALNVAYYYSK